MDSSLVIFQLPSDTSAELFAFLYSRGTPYLAASSYTPSQVPWLNSCPRPSVCSSVPFHRVSTSQSQATPKYQILKAYNRIEITVACVVGILYGMPVSPPKDHVIESPNGRNWSKHLLEVHVYAQSTTHGDIVDLLAYSARIDPAVTDDHIKLAAVLHVLRRRLVDGRWPTKVNEDGLANAVHFDGTYRYKSFGSDFSDADRRQLQPNVQFIADAEQYGSKRTTLRILRYPDIKGDHKCSNMAQWISVIRELQKVHSEGRCHLDIRLVNIVFSNKSKERTGTLIDFDHSRKTGTAVPSNMNTVSDGDRFYKAGQLAEEWHDWKALASVMALFQPTESAQRQEYKEACQCVSNNWLDGVKDGAAIQEFLEQNKDVYIPLEPVDRIRAGQVD